MKGLIWKDILVMRKSLRFYLLVMVFYVVLSLLDLFSVSVVSSFTALMVMIIPVSSFSYDELARWDRVAGGFPLSRGEIVAARYGFVDIQYKLYHRVRTFTAAEYVQLVGTYSDHVALEEEKRKRFFAEIRQVIERLGGEISIYDTLDLQLARKP